jgi:hypothetical protein
MTRGPRPIGESSRVPYRPLNTTAPEASSGPGPHTAPANPPPSPRTAAGNIPSASGSKHPGSPESPATRPQPERAVPPGPASSREMAGANAPAALASSSSSAAPALHASSSQAHAIPDFKRRKGPVPELSGIRELVDEMNAVDHPNDQVALGLRSLRTRFDRMRANGEPTAAIDGDWMNLAITPILRSENARHPGLNAIAVPNTSRMLDILSTIRSDKFGEEGHVRFHLGFQSNSHQMAVDAFKHRQDGFTLILVDSLNDLGLPNELKMQRSWTDGLIKGVMHIPTLNQVQLINSPIFAIHALNGIHDYQPYFQSLHRKLYDKEWLGLRVPELEEPRFKQQDEVYKLQDTSDAFGLLPGKFFKHMQVQPPYTVAGTGERRTALDDAEDKNPALLSEPVNKKGQTLRDRFESLNPTVPSEDYSPDDRTSSIDDKRIMYLDRAIAHYAPPAPPAPPAPDIRPLPSLADLGHEITRRREQRRRDAEAAPPAPPAPGIRPLASLAGMAQSLNVFSRRRRQGRGDAGADA